VEHKIMCPPNVFGKVVKVWGGGTDGHDAFNINETMLEVYNEATRTTHNLKLAHYWPVRKPRPIVQKLPGNRALTTGLRVVDAMFPSVLGGTCAVPGAFGCGKTVISQSISKFSNSNCVIYVGCGERGNEMAEARLWCRGGVHLCIRRRTTEFNCSSDAAPPNPALKNAGALRLPRADDDD
jgi:V-type H+-transporting ATPase subunit A